jgi:hypothetical protein
VRRGGLVLLVGLLASVGLAACSDDSSPPTTASSTSAPDPTTTVPHFTGDAGSPFCSLLRDLDVDAVLGDTSGTPEAIEAGFTRLLSVLRQAAELAPEQLRADTALILEGMTALDTALRPVGYDFDALADAPNAVEIAAAVNDPAFTVAGDRVEAYRTQVCHL